MDNFKKNEIKQIKKSNNGLVYTIIIGLVLLVAGIVAWLFYAKPVTSPQLYLMLGIAGVIVVLGVVFAVIAIKKGEKQKPDYYAFFIIGLTWIPLGFALDNPGFWAMGLVFMAIGLANRDKWKERPKWSEMSPTQRNLKLALVVVLGVMVLLGLVAWYLVGR